VDVLCARVKTNQCKAPRAFLALGLRCCVTDCCLRILTFCSWVLPASERHHDELTTEMARKEADEKLARPSTI